MRAGKCPAGATRGSPGRRQESGAGCRSGARPTLGPPAGPEPAAGGDSAIPPGMGLLFASNSGRKGAAVQGAPLGSSPTRRGSGARAHARTHRCPSDPSQAVAGSDPNLHCSQRRRGCPSHPLGTRTSSQGTPGGQLRQWAPQRLATWPGTELASPAAASRRRGAMPLPGGLQLQPARAGSHPAAGEGRGAERDDAGLRPPPWPLFPSQSRSPARPSRGQVAGTGSARDGGARLGGRCLLDRVSFGRRRRFPAVSAEGSSVAAAAPVPAPIPR